MDLLIRKAITNDSKDICRLINDDLQFGLDVKPDVISVQIEQMNANGNYFVRVAVCGNQIVGFIAAYKTLILEMPNEYVRIIGLAVKKGFRREGIGRQLVDEVVQYANQNNAAYIALNTPPKAEEDHIFYGAMGFEKKSVCFSKNLQNQ